MEAHKLALTLWVVLCIGLIAWAVEALLDSNNALAAGVVRFVKRWLPATIVVAVAGLGIWLAAHFNEPVWIALCIPAFALVMAGGV